MGRRYFEDFEPGATTTFGATKVTDAAIIDFAQRFDPQPFHIDPEAAKAGFAGRLVASGWHTAAMQMRMLCDAWLLDTAAMGSPGIDEVKWLKPVFPGDVLSVRQTILGAKSSRRRPEMGVVQFRFEVLDQAGTVKMVQTNPIMFERREPTAAAKEDTAPAQPTQSGSSGEDAAASASTPLGECTLTADEIVAFAQAYDPQPFHLDAEAGARSHFGGLVASGWHTASLWMSRLVAQRTRAVAEAKGAGRALPLYGPSPGFTQLRWLRPVRVGDTIRFATAVVDRRPLATRPGWSLQFSHNTGHNQVGEKVFEFRGSGFVGPDVPR